MTNNISFQNDTNYNPLFEKMQARFCKGGTIAERLTKSAKEFKKSHPRRVSEEFHMTHANSLPKEHTAKKKTAKKGFFSLHTINTTCLLVLIAGTIVFAGSAIGAVHAENRSFLTLENQYKKTEESLIHAENMPSDDDVSVYDYDELSIAL